MQPYLDLLQHTLEHTRLSYWMVHSDYAWPICESIHFIGLTLLIGTVGLFDLRLLGAAKGLSPASMHGLVKWGIFGFALNLITGTMFFVGIPYQYMYNGAFQAKMCCLLLLGLNVFAFSRVGYARIETLGDDEGTPLVVKGFAAVSLVLWIAVICFGRGEAFFKP